MALQLSARSIRRAVALMTCLSSAAVFLSCASTTIESVTDPLSNESFSRVYVLTGHQGIDSTVAAKIVEGINAELNRRLTLLGIVSDGQSIIRNTEVLTLADSTEIDGAAFREFAPDGLLSIELSQIGWEGRRLPGVTHLRDLTYDVEFTSVADAETIWRGRVSNHGYGQIGTGWREMGEKTAAQIVERLIADGVLTKTHRLRQNPVG